MALRYLAGDEEVIMDNSDAVPGGATLAEEPKTVDEILRETGNLDDDGDFGDDEEVVFFEIGFGYVDDISSAVANAIIKTEESQVRGYPDEMKRFIFEVIAEAVTEALDATDFTAIAYEIWEDQRALYPSRFSS